MNKEYEPSPRPIAPNARQVLDDGRPAPKLLLTFRCPVCDASRICDAFLGAVVCVCSLPHPICEPILGDLLALEARQQSYRDIANDPRGIPHRA
jgi:hypothetical protein